MRRYRFHWWFPNISKKRQKKHVAFRVRVVRCRAFHKNVGLLEVAWQWDFISWKFIHWSAATVVAAPSSSLSKPNMRTNAYAVCQKVHGRKFQIFLSVVSGSFMHHFSTIYTCSEESVGISGPFNFHFLGNKLRMPIHYLHYTGLFPSPYSRVPAEPLHLNNYSSIRSSMNFVLKISFNVKFKNIYEITPAVSGKKWIRSSDCDGRDCFSIFSPFCLFLGSMIREARTITEVLAPFCGLELQSVDLMSDSPTETFNGHSFFGLSARRIFGCKRNECLIDSIDFNIKNTFN